MDSFSTREGYPGLVAEISIRREASEALRAAVVSIDYPAWRRLHRTSSHTVSNLVRRVGDTS